MHSPKIKEDLIPLLYQLAQKEEKPMTKVVDGILREYLTEGKEERSCPKKRV